MEAVVKIICQALKEEAEAVVRCTDAIKKMSETKEHDEVIVTFILNRLDRIGHMQNLILELTSLMSNNDTPGEQKEA